MGDDDPTHVAVAPPQKIDPALFRVGHDFKHYPQGKGKPGVEARVWAHHAAHDTGVKAPLIIYLHGNNGAGYLQQDFPQLFGPPTEIVKKVDKGASGAMHVGEILTPLIDAGTVVPLVCACPSVIANGAHMWGSDQFDLSRFVDDVVAELMSLAVLPPTDPEYAVVEIDLDQVAVVGHSGAGGNLHHGVDLVGDVGGKFTIDGKDHFLKVLGLADTGTLGRVGRDIHDGFASVNNTTTAVYALFRGGSGGWGAAYYEPAAFWHALQTGKVLDEKSAPRPAPAFTPDPAIEDASFLNTSGHDTSAGDPTASPFRASLLLSGDKSKVEAFRTRWAALPAGLVDDKGIRLDWTHPHAFRRYSSGFGYHFEVVGMWTEWAAKRFFHA